MDLTFDDGSVYRYFGVPAPVYQALVDATSKGRYFAAEIRTKFPFDRLR
jgi:hypothetical protein